MTLGRMCCQRMRGSVRADRLRGMDVGVLAHRQHGAADDAAAADAVEQARECTITGPMPGPDHRHHDDQDDQVGEAHPGVDEALHDHVELAAEIARDDADEDRDHGGERRRGEADDHRELRAVEAAREHVAAEIVGAQPELLRRRLQPVDRADLVVAVGRQHVGEDAAEQEDDADDEADGAERLVAEQPAEEATACRCRAAAAARRRGRSRRRRPSAVPHLGIEQPVAEVDQQVDQHHGDADDQEHAGDDRDSRAGSPPRAAAGPCRG